MGRLCLIALISTMFLVGCGDAETTSSGPASSASPEIPDRLDVVCHEDGSTELLNHSVRALADGVHIRVDNRAGESVSLIGVALDFSEGITEQEAHTPPGETRVACWPYSKHTDPEPERQLIVTHDPDGYWTAGELECPRDKFIADHILDYVSDGSGTHGEPEDLARTMMDGIDEDDTISTVGYPEAEPREVAVERDGETIALLSFDSAQKGGWFLGGYSTCDSSGIKY